MAAISINIITKDAVEATLNCLENVYEKLFEEGDEAVIVDTGSTPENLQALEEGVAEFRAARIVNAPELSVDFAPYVDKWIPEFSEKFKEYYTNTNLLADFSAARRVALEESKNPLIFWIDSDDIIYEEVPGALRTTVEKALVEHGDDCDALFLDYDYAFDQDGTCITTLRRERFFHRDRYNWVGHCHETAIPRPGVQMKTVAFFSNLKAKIVHTVHKNPHPYSDIRNYVILRKQYEEEATVQDPRTIFYLANAARGLRRFEEARAWYEEFVRVSGSEDDRFAAHYYIAGIYLDPANRRPLDAIRHYRICQDIKASDPRSYFGLSRGYAALHKWEECLHWYRVGTQYEMPETQVFSYDPTHVNFHPHVIAALAHKEKGDADGARRCAELAYRNRPDAPEAQGVRQEMEAYFNGKKLTDAMFTVLHFLKNGGPNARRVGQEICNELVGVPPDLEKAGIGKTESPDPRDSRPSFAFYCGGTGEDWGPRSRETGIGGSEKMVLLLSELIQREGPWNVSVYASVPHDQRGIDPETGVAWHHWSEFDNKPQRDVLVAWRLHGNLLLDCPARLRVLWLHDVQNPEHYNEEILEAADLVQFQSVYHTQPVKDLIPKEKQWVARNAVEGYLVQQSPTRDPKHVIYMSSPDRGLITACKIVEEARKTDPDIHMTVAYGLTPWARKAYVQSKHMWMPDVGHDISTEVYEDEMNEALDAAGATMLHRVSFKQIYEILVEAGTWLYPTRFPEISCMAAMEAQAFGVVPLSTRFGALAETILPCADTYGVRLPALPEHGDAPYDYIVDSAQTLLQATQVGADDPRRLEIAREAWDRFSIDGLAEQWIEKLKPSDCSKGTKSPLGAAVSPEIDQSTSVHI